MKFQYLKIITGKTHFFTFIALKFNWKEELKGYPYKIIKE